ncbi:MAG: wax ester/triacylglycerol synthase domain-containing protein [Mycobacteriales bacterium]
MAVTADRHLRATDAFTWYMERDPLLRSTVVVVALLDRTPDRDEVRARVDRATRAVPSLRDRIVLPPLRLARPRWARVARLDLSWHLRHVAAAPPGGLAQVLDVARTAATSAFDPARPLWHLTVVEGLEGGRAAFVLAFHHSLTDGIGGIQLARHLFDLQREAEPQEDVEVPSSDDLEGWRLAWDTAAYDVGRVARLTRDLPVATLRSSVQLVRHPRDAVRTAVSVARTVEPYFTTLSPVMRERRLDRSLDLLEVPLPGLRQAAAAESGHLNDAFLAAVTGGLRRYHAQHGTDITTLRMTLPLSLRNDADAEGGNHLTLLRFPLPAGTADPAARLRAIHHTVREWRTARSLPHTQRIAAALNLLPSAIVGSMLKHVDFLASDVPGIPVPVFFAGAKLEGWYPFGPTIGASVNVTLMSYVDTCFVGVNVDTGAIPDPDLLTACLAEGFEEVLSLGGEHDPVRLPLHEATAWTS